MPLNFLNNGIFPDNVKGIFGDSSDLQIYHDGTDSLMRNTTTGNLYIENQVNDKDIIFKADDGSGGDATYFFLDGSEVRITFNKDARWIDSEKVELGTSGDLQLQHNGSSSYIQNYTGDLIIQNAADDKRIRFQCDDGSGGTATYFDMQGGQAGSYLYTQWYDNSVISLGNGYDLQMWHDGTNTKFYNQTGDLKIGVTGAVAIQNDSWDENIATFTKNGSVDLFYDNSKKFETTTNGATITGGLTTTASSTIAGANATADFLFLDDVKASFGTGGDLEIYHDGTHSYIDDVGTGSLYIKGGSSVQIESNTGENMIVCSTNAAVELYYDNVKKIETTSAGATVTGDLTVSGAIIPGSLSGYLPLSGGTMTGDIVFNDSVKANFGTGDDLQIYHDATDSIIKNTVGHLYISNSADDKDIFFQCDDGSGGLETYFFLDGSSSKTVFPDSKQLQFGSGGGESFIYSDGSDTYFQVNNGNLWFYQGADDSDIKFSCDDGSGGLAEYFRLDGSMAINRFYKNVRLDDDVALQVGSGADLQISHNGSNSYISNSTGDLYIEQLNDDGDIYFKSDNGSGGTTTYFKIDGSEADGTYTYTQWVDNGVITFGGSNDLRIWHDSSNSHAYIRNYTNDLYIENTANDRDILFKSDDGSGGTATYFYLDGSGTRTIFEKLTRHIDDVYAAFGTDSDLRIYHDGSNSYIKQVTSATGDLIIEQDVADADIILKSDDGSGGTTAYMTFDGSQTNIHTEVDFRIYDSKKLQLGSGADLEIYHDGSNSYIDETGTGSLYIRSAGAIRLQSDTGENMIYAVNDGAVNLYHNNVKTFETTASGIQVTGKTDTDSLLIGTSTEVTAILDEDNMASDSATALATQQSIKAYVDNSTTGVLTYQGTWNADTNSPTLSSGSGTPGYYYIVSVAGSTDLDGITDWAAGDWAVFSDLATDAWQKIDNTAVGNVSGSGANNRLVLWSGTTTVDSDSNFYMSGTTLYAPNLTTTGDITVGGKLTQTGTTANTFNGDVTFTGDTYNVMWDKSENRLEFWDNAKLSFGDPGGTPDLVLYHDSADGNSYINDEGTGNLLFQSGGSTRFSIGGDVGVIGATDFFIPQGRKFCLDGVGGHTYIEEESDSNLKFYVAGSEQLNITNTSAAFTGSLSAGACSFGTLNITDDIYHVSDTNTYFGFGGGADTFQIVTAGTSALTIDSSQAITCTGDLQAAGIYVGATNTSYDLYNNGTSYFNGNVIVDATLTVSAGSISISDDGSNAVTLTESGSGDFTIDAPDDIRLDAGGGDIVLRDGGTEYGRLSNNSGSGIILKSSAADTSIYIQPNGTGNVYCETDTLIVTAAEGEPAKFLLRADEADDNGDDWYMTNETTNELTFKNNISGSQVTHLSITPSASVSSSIANFAGKVQIPSGYVGRDDHNYITFETDDQIVIRVADSHRLKLTSAAMLPYTDSSYDLGSTALRYSNIWVDNINGGTPTTGGPYLPLSGGTVSGNVAVTGTTTVGSSTGNGAVLHGSKAVTLTENTFTTTLTVSLSSNTACYVKIFVTGDWNSHSAVQYLGEYFLANSDGSYNEPGMIIREVDNTNTDSIVGKIVDPSGTSGNRDFVIQLKADDTVGSNNVAAKVTYEVMGQYVSVS